MSLTELISIFRQNQLLELIRIFALFYQVNSFQVWSKSLYFSILLLPSLQLIYSNHLALPFFLFHFVLLNNSILP